VKSSLNNQSPDSVIEKCPRERKQSAIRYGRAVKINLTMISIRLTDGTFHISGATRPCAAWASTPCKTNCGELGA
jgi:hypothetical protein